MRATSPKEPPRREGGGRVFDRGKRARVYNEDIRLHRLPRCLAGIWNDLHVTIIPVVAIDPVCQLSSSCKCKQWQKLSCTIAVAACGDHRRHHPPRHVRPAVVGADGGCAEFWREAAVSGGDEAHLNILRSSDCPPSPLYGAQQAIGDTPLRGQKGTKTSLSQVNHLLNSHCD